jgi:hypothetical protein
MAVWLEMLAGTPRLVGENQAEKKASHRGHREGMAVGLEMLAGTPRLVSENQTKERHKFNH